MAHDTHIYREVESATDLRKTFHDNRIEVESARSREDLTELFKRAGYLITLTYAPAWKEKFGKEAADLRLIGEAEFTTTARKINQRAAQIGTNADYDEKWGE